MNIIICGAGRVGYTIAKLLSEQEHSITVIDQSSDDIQKINERFVYNHEEISDENLSKLLIEVEDVNAGKPITYFEILTAAYFYHAKNFKNNINLIESGLFHRFDATNIIKENLASIVTAIGLDHLDWLPENKRTIEKIVYEKTSCLLNSKIVFAKQSSVDTLDLIKKYFSTVLSIEIAVDPEIK